jgi:hypothetical protein
LHGRILLHASYSKREEYRVRACRIALFSHKEICVGENMNRCTAWKKIEEAMQ